MKRAFTKRQKKILSLASGNVCEICGVPLKKSFHADHVVPFSKKGKTVLNNAQALCEKCNLIKGNK
jgi:5-methylcytosine-specific restriction endonuclease McrA|tara:strand:+ start:945 stop:1142 length:198 start_codon:yes stop_codon:yes gene_type:complete